MTKFELTNDEIITKHQIPNWLLEIGRYFVILISSLVILGQTASAELKIGGYYKNDGILVLTRSGQGIIGDLNTLRLRFDANVLPNAKLHLETQYATLFKTQTMAISSVSSLDQLVWDRTYLKFALPLADVTVGRQRVAWGTGHLWNPTDVFNSFTMSFAVSEDERSGIEAVRVEVPLGVASGIDLVAETGKTWEGAKKGLRYKTNVGSYDYSLSCTDIGTDGYQVGVDLAGEVYEFGVRSEVAMVVPEASNRYFKSIWGVGYTLENGWGLDLEYNFNGLGTKNKANYDWTGLLAGTVSQMAMDYVYFGINKSFDEITSFKTALLVNADDLSFLVYPSFSKNLSDNLDLNVDALFQMGQSGTEYKPNDTQDTTGFLGANMGLVRLKYSF